MVELIVSPEYLAGGEKVLIIDDFLASGATIWGLVRLAQAAGATVVGIGTLIEKTFEGGRELLKPLGVPVESLAVITSMEGDRSSLRMSKTAQHVAVGLPFLKQPFFYRIFIWMLNHAPFAIPVKRLRETDSLLAFFHPKPAYPFHVILLPKKAHPFHFGPGVLPIHSWQTLSLPRKSLVGEFHLPAYRLIVNGGEYQEFPHLHFHLISDVTLNDP